MKHLRLVTRIFLVLQVLAALVLVFFLAKAIKLLFLTAG
jgi:hypothetical protein